MLGQHGIGLLVADELQRCGIEVQAAAEAVGDVGQVHEAGRQVPLQDVALELGDATAAHHGDEVRLREKGKKKEKTELKNILQI